MTISNEDELDGLKATGHIVANTMHAMDFTRLQVSTPADCCGP